MKPIKKVVFPVGGLGTRFLPATKSLPKEMLPVVNKPLIHYAFEEAIDAGIEQFIFITGRNKNAINNHFDHAYELQTVLNEKSKTAALEQTKSWLPDPGNVMFIRQQEPKGLGHAIWCARHAIGDEPFAVVLADDLIQANKPCLTQLVEAYNRQPEGNMVAVMDVPRSETRHYGVLNVDKEQGHIAHASGLVEKPEPEQAPSTLSVIGRYILQPSIFDTLAQQQAGSGGEVQITDAINSQIPDTPMFGLRFEGRRFDCGNHAGFVQANIAYALENKDVAPEIYSFMEQHLGIELFSNAMAC
jgi:UTP--glucose-1-phosphate uridylyltransferase